jgi:hypothetical protein
MITFEITEDNLFTNNELYKLSLLISGDNFLFALTGLSNGKIKSLREFSLVGNDDESKFEKLIKIIGDYNYNTSLISRKNISFISKEFSIVPYKIGNKIDLHTLMSSVSIKQYLEDYKIIKSEISGIESNIFFPVNSEILTVFDRQFGNYVIHHGIDYLTDNANKFISDTDFILCNFTENSIQTLAFKNNDLISTQVFLNSSRDDILYNILSVYYKNGLLLNSMKLFLSGRIERNSALHNVFRDHIKFVDFVPFDSFAHFSEKFKDTPGHMFFDIYLLSKCV